MTAEDQKAECEAEHLERAATFKKAEQEVQKLEKKLQKYIVKTKPYFEQKENLVGLTSSFRVKEGLSISNLDNLPSLS